MLLAELCDQLLPAFKPSRQKDVKTAVWYLAKALDCPDPQHCSPELYSQPLVTLYRRIEDYQRAQSKSPDTIRNTKNTISKLFRLADAQHLFSLAPLVVTPRYDYKSRPKRPGSSIAKTNGTYLPYTQWPPDLQEAFTTFETWATTPVVPGRPAGLRKRMVTIEAYRTGFASYFGYLHYTAHLAPIFDHLFDLGLVTAYVHWHVNDYHHRTTAFIRNFLKDLHALIRQYRPNEELCAKVLALKKTLPVPSPCYDKTDAWVSLSTLDEIGRSLWPRKQPHEIRRDKDKQHPGMHSAVRAGIALMLQLWTRIPYRQRNMREMRLGDNLHKDGQGRWRLTFRGEQLKIASKRGQTNVFALPFPPSLVPLLEDYLTLWRPIILAKVGHPDTHVFLTQFGTPYTTSTLRRTTSKIIYSYTGRHWHPHAIRTVWATEWIQKTHGDFYIAAVMLNDRLETVIAKYTHLLEEDVAEKAYRLIEERNGQGK
jgi:hypothetical protein